MKRKIYLFSILCSSLIAASILSGCNNALEGDDDVLMQLNTAPEQPMSTSRADDVAVIPGKVLFWTAGESFASYHTSDIDNLNNYNANSDGTNKFNTAYPYPSDGSVVYTTGYSPVKGLTVSSDYKTLSVASNQIGQVDVITSEVPLSGSKSKIFSGNLVFNHVLTQVTFKAKYDYTMFKIRQVQNISVTIPKAYLATEWTWNESTSKYEVTKTADKDLVISYNNPLATQDEEYMIGDTPCYLMLPVDNNGQLTPLTLKCDLYKFDDATVVSEGKTYTPLTIQLKEDAEGKTDVSKALPGDAYEVVFLFSNDTWTLKAVKKPWQKGGLLNVEVDPNGGSNR